MKKKKIIGIFAHPDDESMLCGGLFALRSKDSTLAIYCATKGEKGKSSIKLKQSLADTREKEFYKACLALGVSKGICGDFPDGDLENNKKALEKEIEHIVGKFNPSLIIAPDHFDEHPDHRVIGDVVRRLFSDSIEIWVPTFTLEQKNYLKSRVDYPIYARRMDEAIDISKVLKKKITAIKAHKTQAFEGKIWEAFSKKFKVENYRRAWMNS